MDIYNKIKKIINERPKRTAREIAYNIFGLTLVIALAAFLIIKDITVKKAIIVSLDKAQITYEDVSCGGVFFTDCEISKPKLKDAFYAEEININNVFALEGYAGTSGAEIDVEIVGFSLGDKFQSVFASNETTNNIGPKNIIDHFNGGDLLINGGLSGDGSTLSIVKDLKIESTNGLLPFEIVFNVHDLNTSEAIFDSASVQIETGGIKKLFYNIYLGYAEKNTFAKANLNLLGSKKTTKMSDSEFNKILFLSLHEERKSEFDFYRDKTGGNALYYQNYEKFLLGTADSFTMTVVNSRQKNINEIMFIKESGAALEQVFDINIISKKDESFWSFLK